jgi:hypothetical protein
VLILLLGASLNSVHQILGRTPSADEISRSLT